METLVFAYQGSGSKQPQFLIVMIRRVKLINKGLYWVGPVNYEFRVNDVQAPGYGSLTDITIGD